MNLPNFVPILLFLQILITVADVQLFKGCFAMLDQRRNKPPLFQRVQFEDKVFRTPTDYNAEQLEMGKESLASAVREALVNCLQPRRSRRMRQRQPYESLRENKIDFEKEAWLIDDLLARLHQINSSSTNVLNGISKNPTGKFGCENELALLAKPNDNNAKKKKVFTGNIGPSSLASQNYEQKRVPSTEVPNMGYGSLRGRENIRGNNNNFLQQGQQPSATGSLVNKVFQHLSSVDNSVPPLGTNMDKTAQLAAEHILRRFLGPANNNKFGAVHLIELPVPVDDAELALKRLKK